jgi:hypothetical protein
MEGFPAWIKWGKHMPYSVRRAPQGKPLLFRDIVIGRGRVEGRWSCFLLVQVFAASTPYFVRYSTLWPPLLPELRGLARIRLRLSKEQAVSSVAEKHRY